MGMIGDRVKELTERIEKLEEEVRALKAERVTSPVSKSVPQKKN